jgi:hypothetical protein
MENSRLTWRRLITHFAVGAMLGFSVALAFVFNNAGLDVSGMIFRGAAPQTTMAASSATSVKESFIT